jgi:prepilin-type N-terminal cleavage/methylation domain-containing protein
MWAQYKQQPGFTIVELLIVIVVIGVLASITVVAYNGVQNRAYNTAVQSDLKNLAQTFEVYNGEKGVYPVGDAQLATLGLKVTKSAYGSGFNSNAHNLLYCRVTADGPNKFAIVASSKSGTVFTYKSETGAITTSSAWVSTSSIDICINAGINQVGTDRDIFYLNNTWQTYVGS